MRTVAFLSDGDLIEWLILSARKEPKSLIGERYTFADRKKAKDAQQRLEEAGYAAYIDENEVVIEDYLSPATRDSDGFIIELRPFTIDDIDELLKIVCHPGVTKYIPGLIQDREIMIAWAKAMPSTDHEYMILLDGKVIGECSLEEKTGVIGIMLLPKYWRLGYGTATVKSLMGIAKDFGLTEVQAQTDRKNAACVGLLRSLGFTRIGIGWNLLEEDLENPENDLQTMLIYQKRLMDT